MLTEILRLHSCSDKTILAKGMVWAVMVPMPGDNCLFYEVKNPYPQTEDITDGETFNWSHVSELSFQVMLELIQTAN